MGSRWWSLFFLVWLALGGLTGCSQEETRVIVVAGTTLVDGKLLAKVVSDYEEQRHGVQLSVVAAPTARALALAREGSADVTITHDPDREEVLIADGRAELALEVFSSRFILAGPQGADQAFGGLTATQAFRRIADEGSLFVSRADGSGTYQVERGIWEQAGVDPTNQEWYVQTRQGMGLTLQVASQREAFVLVELSVFLTAEEVTGLVDARLDPVGLENPYRAMAVKGSPVMENAVDFVAWLDSKAGRESVNRANLELYGTVVFVS